MASYSQVPEVKEIISKVTQLVREKQFQQAAKLCEETLIEFPDQPDISVRLAFAKHKLKDYEAAEKIYRHLIKEYDLAILYFNLACVLGDAGKQEQAIDYYKKTLVRDPNHRSAHNNLANLLKEKNEINEALTHYQSVHKICPDHLNSLNGLGGCYAAIGEHEKSIACFNSVIELQKDDYHAHTNLGIELLLAGNFEQGWKHYSWRFLRPDLKRDLPCPIWQGEDIENKRLFIHAEQGAGDVIQFLRYIPHVKTFGAEIVFECRKDLYTLCFEQSGIDIVIAQGAKVSRCDYHLPLLSLPQVFNTTVDTIPNQVPYLYVPEKKQQLWQEKIGETDKCKIGIAWAGNPLHPNDLYRSCDLSMFIPFLAFDNAKYFSLQKNYRLDQLETLPKNINLVNLDKAIFDYQDTAACIMQLDLIITVDTSIAHLAGALGKAVWVLIPYVPDWRWMLEREDSPWYPTMRLFRQQSLGDWIAVVENITHHLSQKLMSW